MTRQLTKSIGFFPNLCLWLSSLAKTGDCKNYLCDFHRRWWLARALDVPGVRGGGVLPVLLLPGRAGRGGGGRLHSTRPHLRGQGRHLPQVPQLVLCTTLLSGSAFIWLSWIHIRNADPDSGAWKLSKNYKPQCGIIGKALKKTSTAIGFWFLIFGFEYLNIWKDFKVLSRFIQKCI